MATTATRRQAAGASEVVLSSDDYDALMSTRSEMYELLDQFRRYIAEGPLGTRGEMYKRIDALLTKVRGEKR